MKKIVLLAVVLTATTFASCKKTYTCACTTTFNYAGFAPDSYKDDSEAYSAKMSEKTAKAACDNKAKSMDASYKNVLTENGTDPSPGVTASTECTLKN